MSRICPFTKDKLKPTQLMAQTTELQQLEYLSYRKQQREVLDYPQYPGLCKKDPKLRDIYNELTDTVKQRRAKGDIVFVYKSET